MAVLKLNNVTKQFGKNIIAVNKLNLTVNDKEFLVLLGPSGCGKTTAMRMVAGLEEVTAGAITIDDLDITNLPPRKRSISMIFQNYAVWPHMTVYDNIAYALKLKKMKKVEIDRIVNDVASMTNIAAYLKRYPSQLSGGQQQRVAVARAIAVKPKIFLMDEPLSNLDAKLRGSMRTELKTIHRQTDATTVFVTHDQSEAMSMADRIVVMKDGEIMQIGSPEEVYDHSANLFVADFIGTPPTNFIDATLTTEGADYCLQHPHFKLQLPPEQTMSLKKYGKREIVIGLRPENITLTNEENSLLSAACLVSEPQGSHQIVAIELDNKVVKIVGPSYPKIKAGERVHLTFEPEKLRFFDPQSTMRITP